MLNKRSTPFLLLLSLLLVLAACTPARDDEPAAAGAGDDTHVHDDSHEHEDDDHEASDDHEHEDGDDHEHGATHGPIAGAREVRIVATEYGFEPSTIELEAGEPVNIVLVNQGAEEHELTIGAFAFHMHTTPGVTATAGFVPDKTGTFDFACFLPGHAEAGMEGEVIVSGD